MAAPSSGSAPTREQRRAELRRLLGADALVDEGADADPYLNDWRRRYQGRALAIVLPRSTAQVAQLLGWCSAQRVPVVPQGGNTGLVGGATPDAAATAVLLSLRRMDRVRGIDPADDAITVEAGCVLQRVQEAALAAGRLFPLSLAAQGSCTIGGNLATNAGGTQVLRYGNARELTLGLEAVLPDGTVWDGLGALRKDNTGYDLKQLFIGSEGTLGVITAATLKLFALPRGRSACLVALADFPAAIRLLERARTAAGPALTAFELMSRDCLDLVEKTMPVRRPAFAGPSPWLALLEWSDHESDERAAQGAEALCAATIEAGEAVDAIVARSLADAAALWKLREAIPEAQARAGGNVKHDVSLPVQAMPAFVRECSDALSVLDARLQVMVFGHLGDGNLHFNVGTRGGVPAAAAFEREAQINDIVFSAVARHAGAISAEHGIGQLRRELALRTRPEAATRMMRSIKQALDPLGIMNPGKLI
jgi:FAD/FMN-containing dehydrogenase